MSGSLNIEFDPKRHLQRALTELEQRQLPFAGMQALNKLAFQIRERWAQVMPAIFDRPTPLTVKAVLYDKATKRKLSARVFIRDETFKGTPPSKYLYQQVFGGQRSQKPFERRLASAGYLPAGMFAVAGRGAQLDAYGNIAGARMNRILSQLGARFDPLQNETETSRERRQKREKKSRRGDFFALRSARGRALPGIYQRITTGFGSALASVLVFVRKATYKPRYGVHDIAQKIVDRRLPGIVEQELKAAIAAAKAKGWA